MLDDVEVFDKMNDTFITINNCFLTIF